MKKILLAIAQYFKDKPYRNLTIGAFSVLLIGSLVYHFVEGWRFLDALYFSVITLTTVGYGDFSPETDFGKIFTIFYILIGVGIILGFVNTLYLHRSDKIRARLNARDQDTIDK